MTVLPGYVFSQGPLKLRRAVKCLVFFSVSFFDSDDAIPYGSKINPVLANIIVPYDDCSVVTIVVIVVKVEVPCDDWPSVVVVV